ncbi:hypothetical protein [Sulfurovum sp. NBC37-1]|uniref:hypothetical protein n=1 Tax=Sulfurovum sp. (strain NBC37-1) TaxID=387093 RepID=UPI0001587A80|nr:hypothetical protein [Sulfurovum sp. NBC37-1]BAF72431.1 conserved hypothetical protein [Sulfurovum sp. NBC37-1]
MKKSTILITGTLLFIQILSADENNITVKEYPLKKMQQQNRSIVKLASEELSRNLPQKVDKYTTLMKIEGKGETLLYIFEINTGTKSDEAVQKEGRTRMQKAVTNGICHSSKRFLDAHIRIAYIYHSATSKKELFRFNVKKKDCEYFD